MVIFALYLKNEIAFENVYLHGLVNDEKGQKMSKSKGNVLSPIDLSDQFGTDALRMSLVVGNTPGNDLALSKDKIKAYSKFSNKMWNATRFVLEQIHGTDVTAEIELDQEDSASMDELNNLVKEITQEMEEYKFYIVSEKLYHYFWHTFADVIIERSKTKITESNSDSAKKLLYVQLVTLLKVLHPFMPFVTEELWSLIPRVTNEANLLMIEPWPESV